MTSNVPVQIRPLPPDKQCSAAVHVLYEIASLAHANRLLREERRPLSTDRDAVVRRNALIESWLTHVRNVDAFFGGRPPRKNDLVCEHFGIRAQPDLLSSDDRKNIDRRISHLTQDRLDGRVEFDLRTFDEKVRRSALPVLRALAPLAEVAAQDPWPMAVTFVLGGLLDEYDEQDLRNDGSSPTTISASTSCPGDVLGVPLL